MQLVNLKIMILNVCCLAACGGGGGGQATNEAEAIKSQIMLFGGVEKLEKISSSSWRLSWTPIEQKGLLYGVFIGSDTPPATALVKPEVNIDNSALSNNAEQNGGALLANDTEGEGIPDGVYFNFKSPARTTLESTFSYDIENIFNDKDTCFLVRIIDYGVDDNEKVLCTVAEEVKFNGISEAVEQNDGSYLLSWETIPVTNISYAIYENKNDEGFDFTLPSYDAIEDNFFKLPVLSRGDKYCFIVRYYHKDLALDTNEITQCLDVVQPLTFNGITRIDIVDSQSVTLNWSLASSADVVGYKIYQGSDFIESYGEAAATATTILIPELVPGRQYSFGIRAFDAFGREDNNLKILSVVMPD